jgi:Transglycosylase SLT domain/Putative binding domain, N-terminal/Ricin-type beta-trefoil lectin domain-like
MKKDNPVANVSYTASKRLESIRTIIDRLRQCAVAILVLAGVATNADASCNITASASDIAAYADQLSTQYKTPSVIIKAIIEQESGWDPNASSADGGIGLMQVTPSSTNPTSFSLGHIDGTRADGDNPFTVVLTTETVDLNRLCTDWRYNMEIGVRILLAKVKISETDYLDLRILENWYYPLAYYNGAAVYNGSNPLSNDPVNPGYGRNPATNSGWKSKSYFPYQECVFNIIAGKYVVPSSRSVYFGVGIQATLPGPSAVASGAGHYSYLYSTFRFFYFAEFHPDGTAKVGPSSAPVTYSNVPIHIIAFGGGGGSSDLAKSTDNLNNSNPSAGDTVTVSITVKNQACSGTNVGSNPFHIGLYWSTNTAFTGVSAFYEAASSACAANGTVSVSVPVNISSTTAPGTYYLGYKIDDESEAVDCDRTNNGIWYWPITVHSNPSPTPTATATATARATATATATATPRSTATPTATATATATATPRLHLAITELSIGYSASNTQTSVSNTGGGTMNWTAASNVSWLTLNTTGGTVNAGGSNTLNFSAQQNDTFIARTGSIIVTASGASGSPQSITVTQDARPAPPSIPIPNGAVIGLVANANGMVVTAENAGNNPLIANRSAIGPWEQFQVIDVGNGYFALRSLINGRFVCADNAGASPLIANRDPASTWESFQAVDAGSGYFAIIARANGKYVCADNQGASALIANRTSVGTWEQFRMVFMPSVRPVNVTTSFQVASTGSYVSAENAGAGALVANRPSEGAWEQFQINDAGNGTVAIRSLVNGKYVTTEGAGVSPLIANRSSAGVWEQFELLDAGGGYVAFRALVNGRYVSAGNAGDQLIANRSFVGWTEQFALNVSLRAVANNAFVCAENSGKDPLIANRASIGGWEQFQVVNTSSGYFGLKAKANGLFVCAENNGNAPLIANRPGIGLWEQFQWINAGNGNTALKAVVNGMFVCAENGGQSALIANRPSASTWEQFQ